MIIARILYGRLISENFLQSFTKSLMRNIFCLECSSFISYKLITKIELRELKYKAIEKHLFKYGSVPETISSRLYLLRFKLFAL